MARIVDFVSSLIFASMTAGVLLSLSRAAWVNYAVALASYLLLTGKDGRRRLLCPLASVMLVGILALAVGVRLYALDAKSFWYDEFASIELACGRAYARSIHVLGHLTAGA